MLRSDAGSRALMLLKILKEQTDEEHPMKMPELLAELSARGIQAERKAVYQSVKTLNACGFQVVYTRCQGGGYYLVHTFTPAEILLLGDLLNDSGCLDEKACQSLIQRLRRELSAEQNRPLRFNRCQAAQDPDILAKMTCILEAIARACPLEFTYFERTLQEKRHYRRNRQVYHQIPYALLARNGHVYGIFYSQKHQGFGTYRLDRMDHLKLVDEPVRLVPFDLSSYLESSSEMYGGRARTITAVFDRSLEFIVLDRFGDNLIVSAVNEKTFTASFRAAINPPLIGWLLQFADHITILKPQSLADQLRDIGAALLGKYERKV